MMSYRLNLILTPGSSRDRVETIDHDHLRVWTRAPARDNQANLAAVTLVAKHLGVRRSQVILEKGAKSRQKTVIISE